MTKPIVALFVALSASAFAQAPQVIPVVVLAASPVVDGDLAEWGGEGWIEVAVTPALERGERGEFGLDPSGDRNATGRVTVELKAGVADGRFYLAARYPDDAADTVHKPWELRGERYQRGNQLEDMFAVRFHMSGEFNRSMLSTSEYSTDVWLWSAARTNPSGVAEDMVHSFTTRLTESAAEYETKAGTVIYISKRRDAGNAPYEMRQRPREQAGNRVPSFEPAQPGGSVADVAAKGVWQGGIWHLEFGRALDTGHADDVAFAPGTKLLGQIAVFNRGGEEHKSVSEPLLFDFSAIK